MTIARRKQLRLDITPYYHCVTRCVRRAFLCGPDSVTGRELGHRKDWIEKHLLLLAEVFCIDVAGYAVMSNHYHVVLHVDQQRAEQLDDREVIKRWHRLYKGPDLIREFLADEPLIDSQMATVRETIAQWRDQLTNISRFMGHLNETVARRANKEDQCKGRFWESRFKLQAILDLKALLRTLCYVDLNPVRAKTAENPETSNHTSFRHRLSKAAKGLMPFATTTPKMINLDDHSIHAIPISFNDYMSLLDYTSRQIRQDKHGHVDADSPPIVARLGYTAESWTNKQKPTSDRMARAVGGVEAIKRYCRRIGQHWIWQESI